MTAAACDTALAVLEDHCADSDPRVRSAAFQALVRCLVCYIVMILMYSLPQYQVHSRDPELLPLTVYFKVICKMSITQTSSILLMQASESLSDNSSEVRKKAIKLVWGLGLRYANK